MIRLTLPAGSSRVCLLWLCLWLFYFYQCADKKFNHLSNIDEWFVKIIDMIFDFVEHTCAYSRWAHMYRFLSVHPSVSPILEKWKVFWEISHAIWYYKLLQYVKSVPQVVWSVTGPKFRLGKKSLDQNLMVSIMLVTCTCTDGCTLFNIKLHF